MLAIGVVIKATNVENIVTDDRRERRLLRSSVLLFNEDIRVVRSGLFILPLDFRKSFAKVIKYCRKEVDSDMVVSLPL